MGLYHDAENAIIHDWHQWDEECIVVPWGGGLTLQERDVLGRHTAGYWRNQTSGEGGKAWPCRIICQRQCVYWCRCQHGR